MHSAKTSDLRLPSMARRVTWVAMSSAGFGGLVAALVAAVAVDRLIAEQVDQRLLAATVTLAGELDEDHGSRGKEKLTDTLDDENAEIRTSGIRLSVFAGGTHLAGDASAFLPVPERCATRGHVGGRVRSCAREYHSWTLVAAQASDRQSLLCLYALAAVFAVVLGAASGALLSTALTRWAVAPLQALSHALRRSPADKPGHLELGRETEYEEVEAIRRALLDLTRRIQLLLDQARRFAADAAHELRTPLTALRGELELLAEESPAPSRPALERATARVARLSELVERLLVLAYPADQVRAGFEAVALGDLVQEVVAELDPEQRARIEYQPLHEGLVRGDVQLLRSLVSNALQNSLKFAPGPITVRLVETERPQGVPSVSLTICDRGPGIPAELRERVFEPFFRALPNASSGHGLGLALIGHIVRVHGGEVALSPVAQGAELVVRLPVWQATAGAA